MYLLRLGLRPWRVATLSQAISAAAVGLLLCLCGFLYWLQSGLNPMLGRMQSEQVITAYLSPELEEHEQGKVIDQIRTSLGAHAESAGGGIDVKFVEPSAFLGNIKTQFPELARELEGLGSEVGTVIPRYVSVSGYLNDGAVDKVRAIKGIESAETSKDRLKQVIGAFQALRWMARLLAGGLCLALLTGLIHLARMNSQLHSDAVSLLRLWGATEISLRLPSILSGASVGLLGGILGTFAWMFWGTWLIRHVRAISPLLHELPVAATSGIAFLLLMGGLMIGALSGLLGAFPVNAEEAHAGR
jgi:cell division protein FtsX